MRDEPFAAATGTRISLKGRRVQVFDVPAHGFIERFEIHAEQGLLPNMDSAAIYHLHVSLIAPSGETVPVLATVVCRDLATAQEALQR